MVQLLDSYQKATQDIVKLLKTDPQIFVIEAFQFRSIISLANPSNQIKVASYQYYNIYDLVSDFDNKIGAGLPFPKYEVDTHHPAEFTTELIASTAISWVPIASIDYQKTNSTFINQLELVGWQRYLRAVKSTDETELTVLSIDPNKKVRDQALSKLKTL